MVNEVRKAFAKGALSVVDFLNVWMHAGKSILIFILLNFDVKVLLLLFLFSSNTGNQSSVSTRSAPEQRLSLKNITPDHTIKCKS